MGEELLRCAISLSAVSRVRVDSRHPRELRVGKRGGLCEEAHVCDSEGPGLGEGPGKEVRMLGWVCSVLQKTWSDCEQERRAHWLERAATRDHAGQHVKVPQHDRLLLWLQIKR